MCYNQNVELNYLENRHAVSHALNTRVQGFDVLTATFDPSIFSSLVIYYSTTNLNYCVRTSSILLYIGELNLLQNHYYIHTLQYCRKGYFIYGNLTVGRSTNAQINVGQTFALVQFVQTSFSVIMYIYRGILNIISIEIETIIRL